MALELEPTDRVKKYYACAISDESENEINSDKENTEEDNVTVIIDCVKGSCGKIVDMV